MVNKAAIITTITINSSKGSPTKELPTTPYITRSSYNNATMATATRRENVVDGRGRYLEVDMVLLICRAPLSNK